MGLRRYASLLAIALAFAAADARPWQGAAAAPQPATAGDSGTAELSDEALAALLAPLQGDNEPERRSAAAKVEGLGAEATTALATELSRLRKTPAVSDASFRDALKAARAADPTADVRDVLLRTPSKSDAERTLLRQIVILRGLAHGGTPRAVRELAIASADDGGALRDESAARIRDLGEKAIAGLILARGRSTTTPAVARWATGQLEGMNRRVPGDCVQTKDPRVLADVLSAFGTIRDPDALGVVLSFVNADRDTVRNAARSASLAYGPDALPRLRDAYLNVVGRPSLPEWNLDDVAHALFKAEDDVRLLDVRKLVADGEQKARASDLAGAASDFDKALARLPDLDQREDLAPTYVAYALSVEDLDRARAQSYLRKALWLAPEGPRAPQAEAELAFLQAEDLRGHGVIDAELYARALQLDPTHARARSALDELDLERSEHHARLRNAGALGGSIALLFAGAVLLLGRKRRVA